MYKDCSAPPRGPKHAPFRFDLRPGGGAGHVHGAVRVMEVEGEGHGLELEWIVVDVTGVNVTMCGRSHAVHWAADCITSRAGRKAWKGGESSTTDVARSSW